MDKNDSALDLDKKIFLLEQNFLRELKRIAEQRIKLEKQTIIPDKEALSTEKKSVSKAINKSLALRLESSLGEKLAKSRETADDLEDKLHQTRIAFEEKLKTVDRMKAELNRRENLLICSIQQIETYLRAVFYMKKEADLMHHTLGSSANEEQSTLQQLTNKVTAWKNKKDSLAKAIHTFEAAKKHLKKLMLDLPEYSKIKDLVEYYLVLELLQEELLAKESLEAEDDILAGKQKVIELERQAPAALVSKENKLLALRSELKNIRVNITQLEEQIDATILGRVKDEAARCDLQNWIKKIYLSSIVYQPPEKIANNILDMLNEIKDFVADALEVAERLKIKDAV